MHVMIKKTNKHIFHFEPLINQHPVLYYSLVLPWQNFSIADVMRAHRIHRILQCSDASSQTASANISPVNVVTGISKLQPQMSIFKINTISRICVYRTRNKETHSLKVKICSGVIYTGEENVHTVLGKFVTTALFWNVPRVDLFDIVVTLTEDSGTYLVSASRKMLSSKERSLFPL